MGSHVVFPVSPADRTQTFLLAVSSPTRLFQDPAVIAQWNAEDQEWSGRSSSRSAATSWNRGDSSRQETHDDGYNTAHATDAASHSSRRWQSWQPWQSYIGTPNSASSDWQPNEWNNAAERTPWPRDHDRHEVEQPDGLAPAVTSKGSAAAPHTAASQCRCCSKESQPTHHRTQY